MNPKDKQALLPARGRETETRLRIIGLCEAYGKQQRPGSKAAAHAARMLALYHRSYARLTGHEATAAEVAVAMQSRESELTLCNSKRNQQPKPKQNKKCEAKVRIPCPYHDLPSPETWKPLLAKMISPEAAKAILARKPVITDPLGNKVAFTEHITAHWKDEHKENKDKETRLSYLDYAMNAVKKPAEIWQDTDGTLKYMAQFLDRGRRYMLAFTVKDDKTTLHTYYSRAEREVDAVYRKRNGKLLYPSISKEGGGNSDT